MVANFVTQTLEAARKAWIQGNNESARGLTAISTCAGQNAMAIKLSFEL